MNLHQPVRSLSFALLHATEFGLLGVPSDVATALLGEDANGPRRRRPLQADCKVTMFSQRWRPQDMGLAEPATNEAVEGDVVIVVGPEHDACVYFSAQFGYHVLRPNRRFMRDVRLQSMVGVGSCGLYEEGGVPAANHFEPLDIDLSMLSDWARFETVSPRMCADAVPAQRAA